MGEKIEINDLYAAQIVSKDCKLVIKFQLAFCKKKKTSS